MKKIFRILIVACLGLFMNSCYYDEIPEPIIPEIPDITETIYFAADIQPIFTNKCIGCHNASNKLDLREGNSYNELVPTYVTAGNADNSALYNKLPGKEHPAPTPSSSEPSINELALIQAWINQGAKNN
jgi:hypothetical protein